MSRGTPVATQRRSASRRSDLHLQRQSTGATWADQHPDAPRYAARRTKIGSTEPARVPDIRERGPVAGSTRGRRRPAVAVPPAPPPAERAAAGRGQPRCPAAPPAARSKPAAVRPDRRVTTRPVVRIRAPLPRASSPPLPATRTGRTAWGLHGRPSICRVTRVRQGAEIDRRSIGLERPEPVLGCRRDRLRDLRRIESGAGSLLPRLRQPDGVEPGRTGGPEDRHSSVLRPGRLHGTR
jgi:hypothetical protein